MIIRLISKVKGDLTLSHSSYSILIIYGIKIINFDILAPVNKFKINTFKL